MLSPFILYFNYCNRNNLDPRITNNEIYFLELWVLGLEGSASQSQPSQPSHRLIFFRWTISSPVSGWFSALRKVGEESQTSNITPCSKIPKPRHLVSSIYKFWRRVLCWVCSEVENQVNLSVELQYSPNCFEYVQLLQKNLSIKGYRVSESCAHNLAY